MLTFRQEIEMLSQAVVNYTIKQAEESERKELFTFTMKKASAERYREARQKERDRLFELLEENPAYAHQDLAASLALTATACIKSCSSYRTKERSSELEKMSVLPQLRRSKKHESRKKRSACP
jgi:hypothetical protein